MLKSCYKAGKKWLACLSIVLLLGSMFPAAVLGSSATMTIKTLQSVPPAIPVVVLPLTESNINTNVTIIDITLANNTWAANIDSITSGTIDSALISTLKGGFGTTTNVNQWNNLLNSASSFKLVASASSVKDTLEITIPKPLTTYDILSDQNVTFTPPASLLQDSSNIPASQFFTITADPQATLSGSLTTGITESNIVSGGRQMIITLVNCLWASDVATDATKRVKLFSALNVAATATPANDAQWNTGVNNALIAAPDPSKVIAKDSSSTVVTITLPPVPSYDISGLQTVTLSPLDPSLFSPSTGPAMNNIINSPIIINPDTNSSISLTTTPAVLTETSIITGTTPTPTLKMTLSDNTWANDITSNLAKQTALMSGFTSATDVTGWNNVKGAILTITPPNLASAYFSLSNYSHDLTITIPAISNYSISANQLITVNVPSTVLTNNYPPSNSLSFTIIADPAVAISGTLTSGVNEMDIVNGGKTIVATLTNATWASSITTDLDKREKLIDDLLKGALQVGSYPDIWTAAVETIKAGATYTLEDDLSAVTITLPPVPGFNISSNLSISSQISMPYLTSNSTFTQASSPSFTIALISNQSASISGTLITTPPTESDIVTGGKTLVITLKNDVWAQDVVSTGAKLDSLIDNIKTTTSTPWDDVQSLLRSNHSNVVRTNDKVLTITLPAVPSYALTQDQTINVSIPSIALATSSVPITAGSFTVKAVAATLSGTAVTAPLSSTSVVAGGKTIIITLKNATWASNVLTDPTTLLSCFTQTANWSNIESKITAQNITLSGNNVLTIKLPSVNYIETATGEHVVFKIDNTNSNLSTLVKENLGTAKTLTASPELLIGQTVVTATLAPLSISTLDVVNGGKKVTITLSGGSWDPLLPTTSGKISSLVSGFKADSDSTSWAMVQTALKSPSLINNHSLVLTKSSSSMSANDILTITLPPVPGYDPVKTQTISLTIPKTVLVPATADVDVTGGPVQINLPFSTSKGPLLPLLGDGLVTLIKTVPLQQIFLVVPTKYITSVVVKQSPIGTTMVNSIDIYTNSNVSSVNMLVNGTNYPSGPGVTYGKGKKFNVGFATVNPTTGTTLPFDATISTDLSTLQSEKIKIGGLKTYSFTDLGGKYSLYKLINNSSLLKNILKYYAPADITVETA